MPNHEQPWIATVGDAIALPGSIGIRATGAPRLSTVIERKV